MKLEVNRSRLAGEICVPGSKSHTIRAIAIATMASGTSRLDGPLESEDTLSCLNAAEMLGAEIVEQQRDFWIINGTDGRLTSPGRTIDMGNSGTSLRIFAGLAATADFRVAFDGDSSLRTRPMGELLNALERLGVKSESSSGGRCPLSLHGPIQGGISEVDGRSSQFLTSLLFASPLARRESLIKVTNLNEMPYVKITLDWLSRQNIDFDCNDAMTEFHIRGGQSYTPFESIIPADFSTACFPLAAVAVTGGAVDIKNLDFSDPQGDKVIFNHLENMGLCIEKEDSVTRVSCGEGGLVGRRIDMNATPDALPVMAVVACFAKGETHLLNVPQARIKETDRIDCMTKELRKMGADITELEDGMIIRKSRLHGTEVNGYGDHRIVMSLAIAGMNADGTTSIDGAEAAAVTYPEFISDFKKLGACFT